MLRGKLERVKRETGQSRAKQQKFLVLSSLSIFFRPFSSLFPYFSLSWCDKDACYGSREYDACYENTE